MMPCRERLWVAHEAPRGKSARPRRLPVLEGLTLTLHCSRGYDPAGAQAVLQEQERYLVKYRSRCVCVRVRVCVCVRGPPALRQGGMASLPPPAPTQTRILFPHIQDIFTTNRLLGIIKNDKLAKVAIKRRQENEEVMYAIPSLVLA